MFNNNFVNFGPRPKFSRKQFENDSTIQYQGENSCVWALKFEIRSPVCPYLLSLLLAFPITINAQHFIVMMYIGDTLESI